MYIINTVHQTQAVQYVARSGLWLNNATLVIDSYGVTSS